MLRSMISPLFSHSPTHGRFMHELIPAKMMIHANAVLGILLACMICSGMQIVSAEEFIPAAGKFPPQGAGTYYSGELVEIDHVNRRGAIRLVGDNSDDRYHTAPSHRFALLPYGQVRYHGAPAELRDVPIGTVLHGLFVLPPEGDETIPEVEMRFRKYVPLHNHALLLEDDFSFYQRQGRAWKIEEIDHGTGKLKVSPVGEPGTHGLQGEQVFEIDASTRIWQGKGYGERDDVQAGQTVQLNLTWAPDWKNGQMHVRDVWLDEASRSQASEIQRQIHIRHMRHRWLPGWVDAVEHQEKGQGIVTVTLFAGMDASLYAAVQAQAKSGGVALAAAEPTLRTWWQEHDSKSGPVLEIRELPDPPPGSSGLQIQVKMRELLDGYRPGRIVRVRPNGFPNVKLPPEERVKNLDDR